jgi:small subunit ribosomal protein S6
LNAYEMTFIVRPDRDEEETRAAMQTVTARLETIGGEVIATAPWNPPRRRMAYPIKDFSDGYYVTVVFRLDGSALRGFENNLKLNENVLRFLIVKASDNTIQQVQQRAQQAYLAASQPAEVHAPAPPEVQAEAPAPTAEPEATLVEQPAPVVVDQAPEATTVEAVEPVEPVTAGVADEPRE